MFWFIWCYTYTYWLFVFIQFTISHTHTLCCGYFVSVLATQQFCTCSETSLSWPHSSPSDYVQIKGFSRYMKHALFSFFLIKIVRNIYKSDKFKCWMSSRFHHVLTRIFLFLCQKIAVKFKCQISSSIYFVPKGRPCWLNKSLSFPTFFWSLRWLFPSCDSVYFIWGHLNLGYGWL